MSEHLHPGSHPDADSLSAFLEGVLPEHERLECLAHFAECPGCRAAAFLAQQPLAAPVVSASSPGRRRWYAPIPMLSAAAAACALMAAVWLYLAHTPATPSPSVVARGTPAHPTAPPLASKLEMGRIETPVMPKAAAGRAEPATIGKRTQPAPTAGTVSLPSNIGDSAQPIPPVLQADAARLQQPSPNPDVTPAETSVSLSGGNLRLSIQHNRGSADGFSVLAGSVTDPSGAAIPGATVTLRRRAGSSVSNVTTDANGQFTVAALPAGSYALQIEAPGFKKASGQIELQAKDLAMLASVLPIGSTAESLMVDAAVVTPDTEPESKTAQNLNKGTVAELPVTGRNVVELQALVPGAAVAARGKLMLKVNSAGALLVSRNAGKHWKTVKPAWPGKAVRVAVLAEPGPAFQLTTDSGSIWFSRDGTHWYPAPPGR